MIRLNVPAFNEYDRGVRIVVGGCDLWEGFVWRKGDDAHAHVGFGIICVKRQQHIGSQRFRRKDGSITVRKPSHLLWHELAHILEPLSGHGRDWRDRITELGFPEVAARYKRHKN